MKKALYTLSGMLLILSACNKQIDSIHPLTQIDQAGELATPSGIVETTAGNYTLLNGYQFNSYNVPRLNIAEGRGNNVTLQAFGPVSKNSDAFFFRNSPDAAQGMSGDFFQGCYQLIVSINATLSGIAHMEATNYAGLSTDDKNAVIYAKGENLFLRAFTYFNLAKVYGKPYYQNAAGGPCVPIKKTADLNDRPAVATVKQVYDLVISDLKAAAQDMKVPVTKANTHASAFAAWALLSRVYLYMGGSVAGPNAGFNQLAVTYADSTINNTKLNDKNNPYSLLTDSAQYYAMFGDDQDGHLGKSVFSNNTEIIFATASAGSIGALFNHDNTYGYGATYVASSDFLKLLQKSDMRKTFIDSNTVTHRVESSKWLCLDNGGTTRAPEIILRMGEIYLNRAEAYAKLGMFTKARTDLEAIHTRARLPKSDIDALSDPQLLDAILLERRIELAFEGHAGFDYFRNGLPMTRIAADNNGTTTTVNPTDDEVAFKLPVY